MPRLPNHNDAILEIGKIANYCLNPAHPRGRHKARVFRHALGIEQGDALWLREELLAASRVSEAVEMGTDALGSRWRIDATVTRQGKRAVVRTIWILRSGETFPRFVTCWVL